MSGTSIIAQIFTSLNIIVWLNAAIELSVNKAMAYFTQCQVSFLIQQAD